ncbi:glycosyltransferase family 1 protein [Flavobacterium sp.]|uniref:glycosyltransferase family 1 protein n=1 Tax=Flavobacterium sp. TaxID=239 RepID=UPI0026106527|nr:glycosyltransferase family 1 protein [Flavobacterium sp.]
MEQPIRILQLFTILNRGGAETNVMNYYRKLDRTRFQFDFIVHRDEVGAYEAEIIALGGTIYRLPPFNPLKIKHYKKQIAAFFDQHTYPIVHGNCSELGIYIYQEAQKRGTPVIIAHGHNATDGWNLKSPFRYYYKKKMMPYINTYFTCGYEAAVWLFGKKNAPKAFTMTNAIDSSLFAYDVQKGDKIREELDAVTTQNFVHVGRFNVQKNHDFLISIFYELVQLDANRKLFLIGIGDLMAPIQNKAAQLGIADKVVFLGSRSDVNELLQGMDVFLFPSLFEGLPVSLVEAQASGVKCYISDGVPKESIIVNDNVKVISLKESALVWAQTIHSQNKFIKQDVSQIIIDKGYDINKNIILLQEKYLALLQQHS